MIIDVEDQQRPIELAGEEADSDPADDDLVVGVAERGGSNLDLPVLVELVGNRSRRLAGSP
jgi:hypothetical protein